MEIETFLSIASFAISVGGLVSVLIIKNHRKEIVLAVVVSALVVTSSFTLYRIHQHDQLISRVEREIIERLSYNTWTFDHIYEELHYVPFNVVNEALFLATEKGTINHKVIEFRNNDGTLLRTRGYYVKDNEISKK